MSFNNCYSQCKLEKVISYICKNEYQYFFNKRNVQGIGFGYKVKNGFRTNKLCIQVFVSRKVPINCITMQDLIPRMYKRIPTDVVEIGIVATSSFTQKIRPVLGGYVICNKYKKDDSGTLGCLVADGNDLFILSNNHSIATSNKAPIKTKIIQPSFYYGGDFKQDVIATLAKYVPIKYKTFFRKPENNVDCAIGKIINRDIVSPNIALIGVPKGAVSAKLNENVKKTGFKTELTTGKITSVTSTLQIKCPFDRTAIFKDQIITTKMSDKGDSGAVLLNTDNYVVGLLMGDSNTIAVCNSINNVLEGLNVHLVTE